VLVLGLLPLGGCYLGHVADGQLRLLRAREPVSERLHDPRTLPEERAKLALVEQARRHARALGLEVGEQYTTYAPWPGDRLLTAVVAARPDSVEPRGFWFPLVGTVPYKAYFDRTLADEEAARLREEGLDVCLAAVPAYSSLGWFADPVTGPLLRAPETDLAITVIHELVHATVYVPGDAALNEGLASFVGEEGAVSLFVERDGPGSPAARAARGRVADLRAVSGVLGSLRQDVAALYAESPPGPERAAARRELVARARARLAATPLTTLDPGSAAASLRTNDACLALEGTYSGDLPRYEALLRRHGGDLRALVAAARAAARAPDPRRALFGAEAP